MQDPKKSASDSNLIESNNQREAAGRNSVDNNGRRPGQSIDHSDNTKGGIANSVVHSLWNGASVVGSYMWNLWTPRENNSSGNSPVSDFASSSSSSSNSEEQQMLGTPVGLQHLSRAPSTESTTGIIDSSRTGAIVGGRSGTSSSILPVGHTRAHSTPERLSHVSYLDSSDYGIRLTGRKAIGDDAILTMEMIGKIHAALPPRFRLCNVWRLIYSTPEYGFSLGTLFSQCRNHDGPTLVVIRDDGDAIFGVFATEPWKPHFGHYGTGECFLWRLEGGNNSDESIGRIKKYGPTGKNEYFMITETTYMAAGCGEGKFGFWLDTELLNGLSQPVPTFDNECLASSERFKCVNLELWGLDVTPLE